MGQVNWRGHYLSLRKSLVLYVIIFVVLAVFLSVTTFSICGSIAEGIRASYPPSGEKYYLTNEQGEQLGEGAYIGTEVAPMSKQDARRIAILEMLPVIAAPIYSAFCIIAAALLFYRNRLKKPLAELRTASEKIANNDLDFSIDYDNNDELGQLCASFEIMRTTLADNFSKMWRQVEERKALNAAFAHDLRTPLTVLKGYNEMLQASENPQTQETAAIMGKHISRMESYVSSMSNLRRMEDAQPEYKLIDLQTVASSLYDSAKIVCAKKGKELILQNDMPVSQLSLDGAFVSQVCNNLISNAVRYPRPKDNLPVAHLNYNTRQPVEGESFRAWGELWYPHPLTEKQMADYELRPAHDNPKGREPVPERGAEKKPPIAQQMKEAGRKARKQRAPDAPEKKSPSRGDR